MNDIENVISRLEKQQAAIDRALSALREIAGTSTPNGRVASQSKPRKRRLSPEGRRKIIAATRKRWAAMRTKETGTARKRAATPSRRGVLSAEGRKRLALAMKKRWAAAKKAGKKQLA